MTRAAGADVETGDLELASTLLASAAPALYFHYEAPCPHTHVCERADLATIKRCKGESVRNEYVGSMRNMLHEALSHIRTNCQTHDLVNQLAKKLASSLTISEIHPLMS